MKRQKKREKKILAQGGSDLDDVATAALKSIEGYKSAKETAKAQQIGSVVRCVMDVLSVGRDGVPVDETAHIVDFGGGTGSLVSAPMMHIGII